MNGPPLSSWIDLIAEAEDRLRAAEMHLGWLLERQERARIADLEAAANEGGAV